MSKHTLELGFHHAIPGWCKIFGLETRIIPECEGGGMMIEETQARNIVDCVNALDGFTDPSAAPDLLEAAKAALYSIGALDPSDIKKQLKQAIAKAEGK